MFKKRHSFQPMGINVANPYYDPAETNVDAWIAYDRKISNDRIGWKIQLSARNLIGDDDPIAITVQPLGEPATVRLAPEKRWFLTSTFTF